ncbi:MAG: PqqD family protein [Phormidesmis sp. RL_2_1]|nr:PqqD family protein [Phormidesmis sp. RL_2_1]
MTSNLLEISSSAVISATQAQISSELPGEAVILNLDAGIYYGLNEVGARIWELITQRSRSFADLHSSIMAEYEVSSEVCKQDLVEVLLALRDAGLVKVDG